MEEFDGVAGGGGALVKAIVEVELAVLETVGEMVVVHLAGHGACEVGVVGGQKD